MAALIQHKYREKLVFLETTGQYLRHGGGQKIKSTVEIIFCLKTGPLGIRVFHLRFLGWRSRRRWIHCDFGAQKAFVLKQVMADRQWRIYYPVPGTSLPLILAEQLAYNLHRRRVVCACRARSARTVDRTEWFIRLFSLGSSNRQGKRSFMWTRGCRI
jgi:hypothetical protein